MAPPGSQPKGPFWKVVEPLEDGASLQNRNQCEPWGLITWPLFLPLCDCKQDVTSCLTLLLPWRSFLGDNAEAKQTLPLLSCLLSGV